MELLAAVLRRDPACWVEFVRRYERLIVASVLATLRRYGTRFCRDDLEDLVSDAWVALLGDDMRRLRAYRPDRGPRLAGWIARVVTNATIDRLRAREAGASRLDELDVPDLSAAGAHPDESAIRREQVELAQRALQDLSDEERTFLVECFYEQRALEEIARDRGVTVGAVYSRKFKISAKLARIVRRLECPDPSCVA